MPSDWWDGRLRAQVFSGAVKVREKKEEKKKKKGGKKIQRPLSSLKKQGNETIKSMSCGIILIGLIVLVVRSDDLNPF